MQNEGVDRPVPTWISKLINRFGSHEWDYISFKIENLRIMGVSECRIPLFLIDGNSHCNFECEDGTDLL
jgi:hypothetical protein